TTKRIGKSILEKTLTRWPVFVDHFNSNGNETDKEPTIVVAEGAFDSVAAHMETEAEEWQSIKNLCQREGELPIRIGGIKMAEPPEFHF
ncbi:hypothetical protein SK431_23530, partial [Escherichia coli]|nr:hypothetical protein [Escherichia coli]MDX8110611.1 hypothetical protein [Escherichia coli]